MFDNKIFTKGERAIFSLRQLYRQNGYLPFKMSKFEEYDLYAKNKDFLVSDRVITFNDTNGRLLALKPDVTLSIIKNTKDDGANKTKVFYNENVYRISETTGQFKEIMQAGLECIGDIDVLDVYEVLSLAARTLMTVSEDFILDISHMGLLSAILNETLADESFKREMTVLIGEKNSHGVMSLCEKYGICEEMKKTLFELSTMYGNVEEVVERLDFVCNSEESRKALSELKIISRLLRNESFEDRVRIDFSVVNNMNYYNGVVFCGFLSGISEGVLSGGEYGKILSSMNRKGRACGFALYLDRLSELEESLEAFDVDVLLLYSDNTSPEKLMNEKQKLISQGKSVFIDRCEPKNLRFKEIIKI